jgi:hypothetical protein
MLPHGLQNLTRKSNLVYIFCSRYYIMSATCEFIFNNHDKKCSAKPTKGKNMCSTHLRDTRYKQLRRSARDSGRVEPVAPIAPIAEAVETQPEVDDVLSIIEDDEDEEVDLYKLIEVIVERKIKEHMADTPRPSARSGNSSNFMSTIIPLIITAAVPILLKRFDLPNIIGHGLNIKPNTEANVNQRRTDKSEQDSTSTNSTETAPEDAPTTQNRVQDAI